MMTTTSLVLTKAYEVFPKSMLWVLIVAAVCCSMGFYEFVWFISVGYGFAVMGIGIYLLIAFWATSSLVVKLMCVLMVVYGFRLGGYLLIREIKNANYKKTLESTGSTKKMPIFVSIFMWVYAAVEYVTQTSAVIYRLENGSADNIWTYIGCVIMVLAIIGEAVADKQKSAAKAINPKRFCDTGLYKICRCPNYFSEILFWTGMVISGIGSVVGKQWIIVAIGYVLIVIIMVNGAQRLEKRHEKNYGNDPEYRKYADTTPIIFPLIPLYHLNKIERNK